MKQRTIQQNRSIHKGCSDVANVLIENGISLNKVIKNLEIRPSMESVKDIFRSIAESKYGIKSTTELQSNQIDSVWEDLIKSVSETTGIFIVFPAKENTDEYINSLDR